jgi:septum formation protein
MAFPISTVFTVISLDAQWPMHFLFWSSDLARYYRDVVCWEFLLNGILSFSSVATANKHLTFHFLFMIPFASYHLFFVFLVYGLGVSAFSAVPLPRYKFNLLSLKEEYPGHSLSHDRTSSSLNMADKADSPLLLVSMQDMLGSSRESTAQLVLASQSPRRREILDMMGLKGKYTVQPSPLDESLLQAQLTEKKVGSTEYTRKLAEAKAFALAEKCSHEIFPSPVFYLGSDTIVELDDCILEKPKDLDDAKKMLGLLSGRQHHVHTGVAVYRLHQGNISLISSFTDTALVTFATLNESDIDAYVASGEPLDKAGKFGTASQFSPPVSSIYSLDCRLVWNPRDWWSTCH